MVSNVVTIEVIMPKGEDAEVLAHLQRRPELLSEGGLMEDFGGQVLEKLLDEYRSRPPHARSPARSVARRTPRPGLPRGAWPG
jgi:hypothetical protein